MANPANISGTDVAADSKQKEVTDLPNDKVISNWEDCSFQPKKCQTLVLKMIPISGDPYVIAGFFSRRICNVRICDRELILPHQGWENKSRGRSQGRGPPCPRPMSLPSASPFGAPIAASASPLMPVHAVGAGTEREGGKSFFV